MHENVAVARVAVVIPAMAKTPHTDACAVVPFNSVDVPRGAPTAGPNHEGDCDFVEGEEETRECDEKEEDAQAVRGSLDVGSCGRRGRGKGGVRGVGAVGGGGGGDGCEGGKGEEERVEEYMTVPLPSVRLPFTLWRIRVPNERWGGALLARLLSALTAVTADDISFHVHP